MTNRDHPPSTNPIPPAGTAGDGQDNYPTYHDRPGSDPASPGTRPTDANLPMARRTGPGPMLVGILAFAAVVLIFIVWSLFNAGETTDEAMTPGDAAAPAASSAPAVSGAAVDSAEPAATGEPALDRDVQPQGGATGPGEITAEPGAVDVPGGAGSDQPAPVEGAPAAPVQ